MDSCTLLPLECFSNREDVSITREFFDLLSTFTYDVEGEVAWLEYLHDFLSMLHEEDGCSDEQANFLLAHTHTLRESPRKWLLSLSADNVHSLEHLCGLIEDTFYHFYLDHLDQKML